MKILGISPLDKDASASLVEDGRLLFGAGEERFSRVKQHAGFPALAVRAAREATGTDPSELDHVAYPFLTSEQEAKHIRDAMTSERSLAMEGSSAGVLKELIAAAKARIPERTSPVHGLSSPNQRVERPLFKRLAYDLLGASSLSTRVALKHSAAWAERAIAEHARWSEELLSGLRELGLENKVKRYEHHLSHAANAYLTSGFDRALIITLDGYGSGLAGSIGVGEGGQLKRQHGLRFPYSLGTFYESVTSALGYHPDRHAGKIVGLAAYGDPAILEEVVSHRFHTEGGGFRIDQNLNPFFARHLAVNFPMVDVAAAWQFVLEKVAVRLVEHWAGVLGCSNVVLSGGVTANVKMNQRIHEAAGIEGIFIYPNMGDGGCGSGIAMHQSWPGGDAALFESAYQGPEFTEDECLAAIKAAGLEAERPDHMAAEVASLIHNGSVVARFDGRMEYGPRALGNRSILYHGREQEVNQWLNQRLGRTEFMPFAPVTLFEERHKCYHNLSGAEHTAEFMTITFDCTDFMKESCPAAVHVDGTARPQLIRREKNPVYYDIVAEYQKLSGIPCLINTSFNMHEEPIVCTPEDAVRAFLDGRLDVLSMGPFLVRRPD